MKITVNGAEHLCATHALVSDLLVSATVVAVLAVAYLAYVLYKQFSPAPASPCDVFPYVAIGWTVLGVEPSPILGPEGNRDLEDLTGMDNRAVQVTDAHGVQANDLVRPLVGFAARTSRIGASPVASQIERTLWSRVDRKPAHGQS